MDTWLPKESLGSLTPPVWYQCFAVKPAFFRAPSQKMPGPSLVTSSLSLEATSYWTVRTWRFNRYLPRIYWEFQNAIPRAGDGAFRNTKIGSECLVTEPYPQTRHAHMFAVTLGFIFLWEVAQLYTRTQWTSWNQVGSQLCKEAGNMLETNCVNFSLDLQQKNTSAWQILSMNWQIAI